jgi:V/A-type H+-transporting ATPase subunit A
VGAFHGLSIERADARKFPSVDPLESWSKYKSFISEEHVSVAKEVLSKGEEVRQMMKVVGEEGTSVEDYVQYLKSDLIDSIYLQQNGFDEVDASTVKERQEHVFAKVVGILKQKFAFKDKEEARKGFYELRYGLIDWNYKPWASEKFTEQEKRIDGLIKGMPCAR